MRQNIRDLRYARIAKKYGMQNSLRIAQEARRAGLPPSLAYALVEQESTDGRNVWGGDGGSNGNTTGLHGKPVTKNRYCVYKEERGTQGDGGMQGVGPCQLTYWSFQDQADAIGGCWIAKYNLRIGITHMAHLIAQYGTRDGVARYNGRGEAAARYADEVLAKRDVWHARLT